MEPESTPKTPSKYILSNNWEQKVIERARDILPKMDMCQCEKCFMDVCALVLNKLTPHYVTTEKGALMMKLPESSRTQEHELTVLISNSAKMVRDKPMH